MIWQCPSSAGKRISGQLGIWLLGDGSRQSCQILLKVGRRRYSPAQGCDECLKFRDGLGHHGFFSGAKARVHATTHRHAHGAATAATSSTAGSTASTAGPASTTAAATTGRWGASRAAISARPTATWATAFAAPTRSASTAAWCHWTAPEAGHEAISTIESMTSWEATSGARVQDRLYLKHLYRPYMNFCRSLEWIGFSD